MAGVIKHVLWMLLCFMPEKRSLSSSKTLAGHQGQIRGHLLAVLTSGLLADSSARGEP